MPRCDGSEAIISLVPTAGTIAIRAAPSPAPMPNRRRSAPSAASCSCGVPAVVGYPGTSATEARASRMTGATGSTGVPTDRSAIPSGCARAAAFASARLSQGNPGSVPVSGVRTGSILAHGRERLDPVRVVVGHAHLGCAARRTERIEEVLVGGGVALPLLGDVVL